MPSRAYRRRKTLSGASFSLIAALFFVVSTSLAAGLAERLHHLSIAHIAAKPSRYLVMVVLDGAQPGYLRTGSLPHLDALRRQGIEYDQAWAGILESETPAGHATISTGSTPARDGLLGFNFIKSDNTAVRLFDPDVVRQGAMEHIMQEANAPTIAGLFKERYPQAKVVAVSGHKYYAVDPLGGPKADYILYYAPDAKNRYVPTAIPGHVPPASILNDPSLVYPSTTLPPGHEDTLAVDLALASFKKVHQQITLINLPEFDWPLGHVYGADPAKAQVLMESFDRDLARIEDAYRKAGVLDQTDFLITADHGMTTLKYIIPDAVLDDAVTAAGTTSPETTYSTAGYIWLQDHSLAQTVADNVVAKKNTHVESVYYKVASSSGDSYARAGGLAITSTVDAAHQYLLQSFAGGNSPDVVAFSTADTSFEKKDAESWKGNHGGGGWQSQHLPLVISGPGVASGIISHSPARLEDIAPTVLSLFRVKATAMQGTILADALQTPSKAQIRTQRALNDVVDPVVAALQHQLSVTRTAAHAR